MANETDGEKGKAVIKGLGQGQQIERAFVAPDGTINVPQSEAKLKSVDLADVDLLLSFSDETFVIIPNGALDATGDPLHPVVFTDNSGNAFNPNDPSSDNKSTLGDLFKMVGVSSHAKSGSLRVVSGNVDAPKTLEDVETPKTQGDELLTSSDVPLSAEIISPAPMVKVGSGSALTGKGPGSGLNSQLVDPIDPVMPLLTPRTTVYEPGHKSLTITDVLTQLGIEEPTFEQALYTSPFFKVSPSGRSDAPLGAYVAGETENNLQLRSSPERQATREIINGTAGNDIIDHNPAFSTNPLQWVKTLHFTFNSFAEIYSVDIVANPLISGIPGFNFQGDGVVRDGSTNHWTITPTANALVNGMDVNVVYNVDDKAAPIDFNVEVTVSGKAEAIPFEVTNNLNFSWREATNVEDFTVFSPSGTPVMILPRDGLGVDIYAGDGNDIVNAGVGHDMVYGGSGDDTLDGGRGNDIIEGGAGADTIFGGLGDDTATYSQAMSGVTATLDSSTGVFNAGDAIGDIFNGIENLTGSAFNDILIGDSSANTLSGTAGDDILEGRGGVDILDGGEGNDTASYTHAGSAILASLADSSNNTGVDAAGDTYVGIENLAGSAYNDTLVGNSGDNTLAGGNGDDILEGMAGADNLDGGSGSNTASYEHSARGIIASLADATLNSGDASGDSYSNIQNLVGSAFNDMLSGDSFNNVLTGGDGNDILEGMDGADVLDGGSGTDTATYASAAAGISASLADDTTNTGAAAGDIFSSIENLTGSAFNDNLIGDSNANVLSGGAGDDILEGMYGADILNGGSGTDTASYANAFTGVTAALTAGFAAIQGGDAAGDTYVSIENLTGSAYRDTLIGNSGANILSGGNGDDILEGMAGADTLDGGSGSNTASYEHASGTIVASLADSTLNSGDAFGDSYTNIQNLTGSTYSDTLIGDAFSNTLTGGDGNDILDGGAGNVGDALVGGGGIDTATYANTAGGVTVALAASLEAIQTGDGAGDTFSGVENLIGSAYGDILIGDNGANSIFGGAGNDTLEGMAGTDSLDGGSGSNTASYVHSLAGVVASLADASINSGDALGDSYANIQNLAGSAFDDTLVGDIMNNTLTGGSGNDTLEGMGGADNLVGGSGIDTATYANATGGVAAVLSASLWAIQTGDATGDIFNSVENLEGSAYNDNLIGDASNNTLTGSDGDDILEGMIGADILDGGSGSNTASYEHSARGVIASLTDSTLNSGDALGDSYTNIQNFIGSAFNDTLSGDAFDNILAGGAGNDTLEGMAGADILDGGSGSNTASYEHATVGVHASLTDSTINSGDALGDSYTNIQRLAGSAFNDTLIGDALNNTLSGGEGDDTLEGMAGADILDGGGGSNTASYEHAAGGVVASLADTSVNSGDASGDSYTNIHNLTGSAHDDTLVGNGVANILTGGAGNDLLDGGAGTIGDILVGGGGIDTATYANATAGVTAVLAAGLAGLQTGDATGDTFSSVENLVGSAYGDVLIGDIDANSIFAGGGNDTLEGMGGADLLDGGSGSNTVSYEHADGGVVASLGDSTLNSGDAFGDSYLNIQNLTGSIYSDTLVGDAFSNTLTGGDGNDLLDGGAGSAGDVLVGGAGIDTATYANATAGVTAALAAGLVGIQTGDGAGDTFSGIENLVGSVYGDTLIGDNGANSIFGGAGNDTLEGMAGADILDGGGGSNTASYDHSAGGVLASLTDSTVNSGDASGDSYTNIQNLTGSASDDNLIGDAFDNTLAGGAGNDTLEGMAGADNLVGGVGIDTATYANATAGVTAALAAGLVGIQAGDGAGDTFNGVENLTGSVYGDTLIGDSGANSIFGDAGNDTLEGMAGADILDGGGGTNTASYEHSTGGVLASLIDTAVNSGDASGDSYTSIQNLAGSVYNDTLIGDTLNNTLSGGDGDDTLEGMTGADILDGGGGSNTASYEHAAGGVLASLTDSSVNTGDAFGDSYTNIQNLTGSASADTLIGDAFDNTLTGGAGNDTLEGMAGADNLVGGGGIDTATYANATLGVTAALTAGLVGIQTGDGAGDTFSGIENLIGSAYGDVLIGDSGANSIFGGAGNDTLEGMAGADILDGGNGSNTASYEHATGVVVASLTDSAVNSGDASGDSYISIHNLAGSAFDDTLVGDIMNNILTGGGGNDTLEGMAGADILDGGSGSNTASYEHSAGVIIASLADSTVNSGDAFGDSYTNIQNLAGSVYDDVLIGNAGANSIFGGAGNDILEGMAGADILDGGSGSNTASYEHAAGGVVAALTDSVVNSGDAFGDSYINIQNIVGSVYNDTLVGNSGGNILTGGAGNDTLEGMAGADILDGGSGSNTASYEHATAGVFASLVDATLNSADAFGDSYTNIQNFTGSAYDDTLVGDSGANILAGGLGNDLLDGGAGSVGDALVGGDGIDTATYANASAGVTAALVASLVASQTGDATNDSFDSIENLIGSTYGDILTGDSGVNSISGGAGNDTLDGMAGADFLDGGSGIDTATYANATASVTAALAAGLVGIQTGDAAGDTFSGVENLIGSVYGDILIGDSGANSIFGGAGNDTLEGMAGADALDGGSGNNTASYERATGLVLASLANATGNSGEAAGDSYTNIQNLIGSSYDDTLIGNGAANILTGGLGNDLLDGGAGSGGDSFDGGGGIDTATYVNASAGVTATLTSSLSWMQAGDGTGDTFNGIENLIGSAYADTLIGDSGANNINGGAGNDILEGMAGADSLVGGGGIDAASYAHAAAGVIASLTASLAPIQSGDASGDTFSGIVNLIGSAYADTLIGDSGANNINGGAGDDILEGMGSGDILNGGSGNNTVSYEHSAFGVSVNLINNQGLFGDAAGDTYSNIQNVIGSAYGDTFFSNSGANNFDGGAGVFVDVVSFFNTTSGTGVTASLTTSFAAGPTVIQSGDAAGDTFTSIESLVGTNYNDTLIGNAFNNQLDGKNGDDVLEGMGGADNMNGGAGSNTASYAHSTGDVVASLTNPGGNSGDAAGDQYTLIQNLAGSDYADTLTGDINPNTLTGGLGDDTLNGLAGDDIMNGGNGADIIHANLGHDSAYGGNNNDTFYVSTLSGNLPTTIDGGARDAGEGNVMVLQDLVSYPGSYNMTALAGLNSRLVNIDTMIIRGDGATTAITISGQEVQNMVDNGTASQLYIHADNGDTISLSAPAIAAGQTMTPTVIDATHTDYTITNASSAQIAQIHWITA